MIPGSPRVLIVDDDPALLDALPKTLYLSMPGIQVDTVGSAAAALDHIAAVDYDAIITDIKMPGMDGVELLGRIRDLRPDTPTLVMTGHGQHDLAQALSTHYGDISVLLDHVLAQTLGTSETEDDVAVLALRPLPLESTRLALRLPANPSSLGQLRKTLRRWLASAGLEQDIAVEITTACNEACANAIEHAYGPGDASVSFEARLDGNSVAVTVRDTGCWRAPSRPHQGFGLTIMRSLMESVDLKSGPEGTTVLMRRRVTPKGRV